MGFLYFRPQKKDVPVRGVLSFLCRSRCVPRVQGGCLILGELWRHFQVFDQERPQVGSLFDLF